MRSVLVFALACLLPLPVCAQDPPDDMLRIGVELVQIDVVVTDSAGKRVKDLTRDDFEIYEDGKLQEITSFKLVEGTAQPEPRKRGTDAEPAPPRSLKSNEVHRVFALVVDDFFLSFTSVPWTKHALRKFVDEQMQEGDLVAVILSSKGLGSLQQFTTDKQLLHASIDRIRWNMNGPKGPRSFDGYGQDLAKLNPYGGMATSSDVGPRPDVVDQFNNTRNDNFAVGSLGAVDFVVASLKDLPGRKSLVWFTEGFPMFRAEDRSVTQSKAVEAMRGLADRTNRAGVVLYPIDVSGLTNPLYEKVDTDPYDTPDTRLDEPSMTELPKFELGELANSQTVMHYLAYETGGFVYSANEPSVGLKRVIADQESYYFIGYEPAKSSFEPEFGKAKFHDVDVRIKRPGLRVRSRSGFLGYTEAARIAGTSPAARLAETMLSPIASQAVDLELSTQYVYDGANKLSIRSTLRVDARDLTFKTEANGRVTAAFDVVAFTSGEDGSMEGALYQTKRLDVTSAEAEQLKRKGLIFVIDLPIKRHGPYQVRAAIRDLESEQIGSAGEFIAVPDLGNKRLAVSGGGINQATALGLELTYYYAVYNAVVTKAIGRPTLHDRISLWRDGKRVFSGAEDKVGLSRQTDWRRVNVIGSVKLASKLAPGDYTLQIDVIDQQASKKSRVATQWVDFDVE